jgi:hypothetical protein
MFLLILTFALWSKWAKTWLIFLTYNVWMLKSFSLVLLFLKSRKFFYFFFALVLDLKRLKWFLGPTPASGGKPSFQKRILLLKITQIFLFFFALVLGIERLKWLSRPTPASGGNLSASLEIQKLTLLKNLGNQNFSEFKKEFPVEFFLKFYGDN